jgi:hypothetical protein
MKITVKKVFIFQVHTAKLRQKLNAMTDIRKQDETAALVHCTYSRGMEKFYALEEKGKRIFYYVLHRLLPAGKSRTPSITVTEDKVCVEDMHEPFHDTDRQLQRINIRDAGKMNIIEIAFQRNDLPNAPPKKIHIPVPKSRLKEAVGVVEKIECVQEY